MTSSFGHQRVHGVTGIQFEFERECFGHKNVGPECVLRMWLPYVVQKMEDSIGGWIILNRHYKPLGHSANTFAVYKSIPRHMRIRLIVKSTQLKLWGGSGSPLFDKAIFLYHDGSVPYRSQPHWSAYQKRLQIIAGLKCMGDRQERRQ